jgi:hypothetical protein
MAGVPIELFGEHPDRSAGFWLKAIDLTPDLSRFRLYYTPISRSRASWIECGERRSAPRRVVSRSR